MACLSLQHIGKLKSYLNQRFGRLVVKGQYIDEKNKIRCICECDCGAVHEAYPCKLGSTTKSCGCLKREEASERMKARKGVYRPSDEARRNMSASQKQRVAEGRCPLYVDGTGHERRTERKNAMGSVEYKIWRDSVFMRDDFTCQHCGARGVELHADHIKPWAQYPELRYETDNGQTLCVPCHRKTPTWGGRTKSNNNTEI